MFWAAVLSAVSRYDPFDTAAFFSGEKRHAIPRFIASLVILNIGPIMWLWFLYTQIVPDTSGVCPVMAAAIASLSVFGFHRILHAVIATPKIYSIFYSEKNWKEVIEKSGRERRGPDNRFVAHFLPGVAYLIIPTGVAYLIIFNYKCKMEVLEMWQITNGWDVITAVSVVVSTAMIVLGVFFAYWQLKEARKTRQIEAFNIFLEIWGSIEEREARRFVFRKFSKLFSGLDSLAGRHRRKIEMVLANCNRISYLTSSGLVPEKDVLKLIGRSMIRVRDCLKPFIDARRKKVGEKSDDPYGYMASLEEFVKEYRNKLERKSN